LVVSIKARGSIRAVSRKVFSFRIVKMVVQTCRFATISALLILATPARAQTSNLLSTARDATPQSAAAHAKVVIVQDPNATDAFQPRESRIQTMVERGVTALTGKPTSTEAWLSLVTTRDTVGIKVFSEPGPNSGTRPAVVAAVITQLLAAGLPPRQIIIWDKHQTDLRLAGYFDLAKRFGVRVAGSAETGYDENVFYDTTLLGSLVWGDFEFGKKGEGIGRKSFVSKLVTSDMTKIINITPLLNHNEAGVFGNLYCLAMGSVDNIGRFEGDHARLAAAVPEIYALPALSDHVVLSITDALICQYEGEERSLLHYSSILNQLRFSRDPVALDVLSLQELENQRQLLKAPEVKNDPELYNNAALLELGIADLKKIEKLELH
jgi:hypothetical protein